MGNFHHTAGKGQRGHKHELRLNFKSAEVKKLAPKLEREVRALFRKFKPLVEAAKKRAKAAAKKGRKRR